MAILALSGLRRHFRGVKAIDGVDLELRQGECLGLIGPNGAGKSTLFRMVVGLLAADTGHILLQGRDITRLAPEARFDLGVAWAFQHARCFPSLTPRQHLAIALAGARSRPLAGRAALEAWLERLALRELADRPAAMLSLAERKLLDFARAACCAPAVLLLDEPFAGLDAGDAALVIAAIASLRAGGTTILLVEHRLAELLEVADEIAVLAAGRLLCRGEPRETLAAPEVLRAYFGVGDA